MLRYFFLLQKVSLPLREYSELERMLAMRKLGYSYQALADKFKVEKTTIRYLCRKFGLSEKTVQPLYYRERIYTISVKKQTAYDEKEGPINQGKTYAEYLKEDEDRRHRRKLTNRAAI